MQKSFPLKIFALLFAAGLLLLPQVAGAIVTEAIAAIAAAVNLVYSVIINLEAALVQWLLDPQVWDEAFTKNPTIVLGWRVIRDFANLGFVLAIVVIAIGFILRIQTYGSQRTLTRLITAAILVNFSLVIAGIFIDAANIVTRFFLESFRFTSIAASLIDATGIKEVFMGSPNSPLLPRIVGFVLRQINPAFDLAAAGQVLFKFVIVSIFAIMMIAALGALVVMLLIRVAHLWVLLVLAPLAWLLWIFPHFERQWREWWQTFIRWTFFAPIVTFFLAFSISLIGRTDRMPQNSPQNFFGGAVQTFGDVFRNALALSGESPNALIAKFVISLSLLVMSMIIANQMGITFADQGIKWVTAAGKWPGLAAWRTGLREGRRGFATSKIGQQLEKRFAGSRLFGGASDWIRKTRLEPEQDVKNLMERYKHLDPGTRLNVALGRGKFYGRGKAEAIAAARSMSDGEFQALSPSQQRVLISIANSVGADHAKELLKKAPSRDLIEYYDDRIARYDAERFGRRDPATGVITGSVRGFARKIPLEDIPKLPESFLREHEALEAFTIAAYRKIANEADDARKQAVKAELHTAALAKKLEDIRAHPDLALTFG